MTLRALALLPVLLASMAVASPTVGNIEANTSIRRAGFLVDCNSALLIPRSAKADRNIGIVFGALDRGAADLPKLSEVDLKARLPGTRESRCTRWNTKGHYLFADVPAGEYYVVLRFERDARPGTLPDRPEYAGLLMRRALVQPGATARLRFQ